MIIIISLADCQVSHLMNQSLMHQCLRNKWAFQNCLLLSRTTTSSWSPNHTEYLFVQMTFKKMRKIIEIYIIHFWTLSTRFNLEGRQYKKKVIWYKKSTFSYLVLPMLYSTINTFSTNIIMLNKLSIHFHLALPCIKSYQS